jgi:hypothetical protein
MKVWLFVPVLDLISKLFTQQLIQADCTCQAAERPNSGPKDEKGNILPSYKRALCYMMIKICQPVKGSGCDIQEKIQYLHKPEHSSLRNYKEICLALKGPDIDTEGYNYKIIKKGPCTLNHVNKIKE